MEQEILKKFEELEEKIDVIYKSTEKTRKYILWQTILNVTMILLPLLGLAFIIPWFLSIMTSAFQIN